MKIVLHMGQSKTGTSSLQESLHAAATSLRQRRVLYPSFAPRYVAHQLLLALCGAANHLPPWRLEGLGGIEGAAQVATRAWDRITQDIQTNPPELLILSSEYLIQKTDGAQKATLAALVSALSSDITPVIYVRHPVDHYRSRLQQWLRSRDRPLPPNDPNLQVAVLDTEAAFGRKPELVAFNRKTLIKGDIVADFATRFLSPWVTPADLPEVNTNAGLSAEALVLLSHLRAEAGGTVKASMAVARLIPRLEQLDQVDPPMQPFTLLPEVEIAALRAADGHRRLVETGRLELPGLDIDQIDGAPPPDWMQTAPPTSLFVHDPARLARLRAAFEEPRTKGKTAKPEKPPQTRPLRLGERLQRFLRRKLAAFEPGNKDLNDRP